MILLSASGYTFLIRSIYDHAPHALRLILYEVGYSTGDELMSNLRGLSEDKGALMRYAVETFKQAGYGDFEIVEFDLEKPYVRIHGKNLFETSLMEEMGVYRGDRVVDNYSRGMFAGCFSQLLGTEVVCEELACQSRGEDSCEFVIMPYVV